MALRDNDRPSFGNAVTPMDMRGEEINEAAFRHMLRYTSDAGTTVFIGGPHATEFVNLNRDERRRMEVVEEQPGQHPGERPAPPLVHDRDDGLVVVRPRRADNYGHAGLTACNV